MAQAGITAVGEFHYLHRDPEGHAYDDPNLLSHQVIAAAQSVGLRICLLRTAYFRAGFERAPHPGQRRFYETLPQYLRNLEELQAKYIGVENVTVGAAPHSIRAVPLAQMKEIAERRPCALGHAAAPAYLRADRRKRRLRGRIRRNSGHVAGRKRYSFAENHAGPCDSSLRSRIRGGRDRPA
jgi:hypothetical protein